MSCGCKKKCEEYDFKRQYEINQNRRRRENSFVNKLKILVKEHFTKSVNGCSTKLINKNILPELVIVPPHIKLIKKWAEMLVGLEEEDIANMAILLDNEERYLNSDQSEIMKMGDTIIPLVREIYGNLTVSMKDLVGIQPMRGPVGLAYALRFESHKDGGTFEGSETTMGEVGLTVKNKEVKVKTRKMRPRWSEESKNELVNIHGIDIEEEMTSLLSYEITNDIMRELIAEIHMLAQKNEVTTWEYKPSEECENPNKWDQEKFRTLYTEILTVAEEISRTTRMGAGNVAIVSPRVAVVLQSLPEFEPEPITVGSMISVGLTKVGTIYGIKIYRDTFATEDHVIVGYGGMRNNDAGIFFTPYMLFAPVKSTGDKSFKPRTNVMSRYNFVSDMEGSENYFRYIEVKGLSNMGKKDVEK